MQLKQNTCPQIVEYVRPLLKDSKQTGQFIFIFFSGEAKMLLPDTLGAESSNTFCIFGTDSPDDLFDRFLEAGAGISLSQLLKSTTGTTPKLRPTKITSSSLFTVRLPLTFNGFGMAEPLKKITLSVKQEEITKELDF